MLSLFFEDSLLGSAGLHARVYSATMLFGDNLWPLFGYPAFYSFFLHSTLLTDSEIQQLNLIQSLWTSRHGGLFTISRFKATCFQRKCFLNVSLGFVSFGLLTLVGSRRVNINDKCTNYIWILLFTLDALQGP